MLETEPEQRLPHATPTLVSTQYGVFDVMWASSEQDSTSIAGCADGPAAAVDRGFAFSRVGPALP